MLSAVQFYLAHLLWAAGRTRRVRWLLRIKGREMEENILIQKNQKTVKIFTWIILVASALVFFSAVLNLFSSSFVGSFLEGIMMRSKGIDIRYNETPYIILASLKLIISAYIILSAVFVLQYKEIWRKQIIVGIILAILYMLVSPLIYYYNFPQIHITTSDDSEMNVIAIVRKMALVWGYFWSIAWSIFFIVSIVKYNKREVKLLFS